MPTWTMWVHKVSIDEYIYWKTFYLMVMKRNMNELWKKSVKLKSTLHKMVSRKSFFYILLSDFTIGCYARNLKKIFWWIWVLENQKNIEVTCYYRVTVSFYSSPFQNIKCNSIGPISVINIRFLNCLFCLLVYHVQFYYLT